MEERFLAFGMVGILAVQCYSVCCQTTGVWFKSVPCDPDGIDGYRNPDPGVWDIATGNRYLPEYTGQPRTGLSCADGDVFYVDQDQTLARLLSGGLTDVNASSQQGGYWPQVAFDGRYGSVYISESEADPWLQGDLGEEFEIIGSTLTISILPGNLTVNLHFLVASTELELSDHQASLCHIYPEPETASTHVEWLPCAPAKSGRYFKLSMILDGGHNRLKVWKLEVYGY